MATAAAASSRSIFAPQVPHSPQVESLRAIFPGFDVSVLQSVLESVNNVEEPALEILLGMSDPDYVSTQTDDQEEVRLALQTLQASMTPVFETDLDDEDPFDQIVNSIQALTMPKSGQNVSGAERVLARLEEEYRCSLCFDIIACPYGLHCGHNFCALCLLNWCFAAVGRCCGFWHEQLACPLCRAKISFPSNDRPRSVRSFPFVPARDSEASIAAALSLVKNAAGLATRSSKNQIDEKVAAWGEGGSAKAEWDSREKRGRTEMELLHATWSALDAPDFIAFKERLQDP